jgi:hypothetical protein
MDIPHRGRNPAGVGCGRLRTRLGGNARPVPSSRPEAFLRVFVGMPLFSARPVVFGSVPVLVRFGLCHSGQANEKAEQQER